MMILNITRHTMAMFVSLAFKLMMFFILSSFYHNHLSFITEQKEYKSRIIFEKGYFFYSFGLSDFLVHNSPGLYTPLPSVQEGFKHSGVS